MITKLCRVVINDKRNSPIRLHDSLTTKLHEVTRQTKNEFFSFCTTPGTTKLGRMETYNEGNPLTTWSHEVMWQIENLISVLLQDLWPPNMTGWGFMVRGAHLWSHMILWQRGDLWSRDRLKRNISSLARLMFIKFGKLVIFGEVNAPMKSHVPLTTWEIQI